jgi:hypothetical protein
MYSKVGPAWAKILFCFDSIGCIYGHLQDNCRKFNDFDERIEYLGCGYIALSARNLIPFVVGTSIIRYSLIPDVQDDIPLKCSLFLDCISIN